MRYAQVAAWLRERYGLSDVRDIDIIGIGIIALQRLTGLVKLDPSTYYVSTVPVEFNIPLFVLINIATLLISVFVLIAPSYLISHIQPAKSMRYE